MDTDSIPASMVATFIDLVLASKLTKAHDRPLVWAFDRMERTWLNSGLKLPAEVVISGQVLAWELAHAHALVLEPFKPAKPYHAKVDTWIERTLTTPLEMVCRWALDQDRGPGDKHKISAMAMATLALNSAQRRVDFDPDASEVLELLQAGHLPADVTARMLNQLTPCDEARAFEFSETDCGIAAVGDIVHLAVRSYTPNQLELITVVVDEVDDEDVYGHIAADPSAPAVYGRRVGDEVAFRLSHIHERIHRPPEFLQ